METLCWNRCFICSSPLEVTKAERIEESSLNLHHHSTINSSLLRHKTLFQYLLVDFQDAKDGSNNERKSLVRDIIELENGTSITSVGVRFCSFCNQLAEQVKSLQLKLEVVQMKLIDKLKTVTQCVLSNSRLYGSNDGVRLLFQKFEDQLERRASAGEQCENERKFLDVLHRFQTFIFESDVQVRNIPLVYLNKYTGGYGEAYPLLSSNRGKGLVGGLQKVAEMDKVKNIKEELVMENDFLEEYEELPFLATYSNSDEDVQTKNEILTETEAAKMTRKRKKKGGKKRKSSAVTGSSRLSIQIKKAKLKTERKTVKKPKPEIEDTGPTRRSRRIATTTRFEERKPKKSKSAILRESLSEAQKLAKEMKDKIKQKRIAENTYMLKVPKRGMVTCEECPFESNVAPRTEQHFMMHEGTDPSELKYECPECKKRFKRYQYFEFHVTHYCGSMSWRCDICTVYFPRQEMKKHLEEVHGSTRLYPCDHCSFSFANFANLITHFALHNRAELKHCLECGDGDGKRPYFLTRQKLLRHLHEVHGHNEIALKCNYENCSATFYDSTLLAHHKHVEHERKYVCETCDRAFDNKSSLDTHILVSHEKAKLFQCEQCPEKFTLRLTLEKHMIRAHNLIKYKCEQCPEKIFTEEHSLRCHLKMLHGIGDMEFIKCRFCSKQFLEKGRLKRHEFLHLDKRDFTCDVCGFATKTKRMLHCHMLTHAAESEKKHACSYCPKKFALKKYLDNHLRIHTLERPYQCEVCGATFNQKGPLIGHRKKIHNAVVNSPLLSIWDPEQSQQQGTSRGNNDNTLEADNLSTVVPEVKCEESSSKQS